MDILLNYDPNEKQKKFHACGSDNGIYGGAKGGGKTKALVEEAFLWGYEHPKANMYIFRETYDALERNVIKEWKDSIPKELYDYSETKHIVTLKNGTTISFRYISNLDDARGYNGSSMDWIGVDELTFHTKEAIQILLSCLRSAKGYKPKFRGTCNPGGIGHTWVKDVYIAGTNYGKQSYFSEEFQSTIAFIPATVYDNTVIMEKDPMYVKRLENLPETERRAYLYGDWDIFQGQYFAEFRREIHTCSPFDLPKEWNRFISLDYGQDMTAALWWAVSPLGWCYVYRELCIPNLIYSNAAKEIVRANNGEKYMYVVASPDLWNRSQESGECGFEIMIRNGLHFIIKANNNRIQGWRMIREYFKLYVDEFGLERPKLKIFDECKELIRCTPLLQHSKSNPEDAESKKDHDITHALDSLRYGIMSRPQANEIIAETKKNWFTTRVEEDEVSEFCNFGC